MENATLHKEKCTFDFRGESFQILYHFYIDNKTGMHYTISEVDEINLAQVYDQYREKHGIPGADEIKNVRQQYGLTSSRMSEVLGLVPDAYDRYERGEVPSLPIARLILSIKDPKQFNELLKQGKPPSLT